MSISGNRVLFLFCILTILSSLILSGCSDNFEAEKLAEDTAVILNDWWDYISRFFTTLWDNLTCVSSFATIFGFLGYIWHKVR